MNQNHSLSYDEKNQFMPQQQQPAIDPTFDHFMKSCISDPKFFQSMKSIYLMAKVQTSNSGNVNSSGQSYQSQPNLMNGSSAVNQPTFQDRFSQNNENVDEGRSREVSMKRKPANPLLKYQPQPKQQYRAQEPKKVMNKNPASALPNKMSDFDQKPIRSKYTENTVDGELSKSPYDLKSMKQNQSINIDGESLRQQVKENNQKRGKESQQERLYRQAEERPIKGFKGSGQQSQISTAKTVNLGRQNQPYNELEERPIKAITKDFKEMIRQQLGPFSQQEEQRDHEPEQNDNENSRKIQSKKFLKRGSRQHLSSAITRNKKTKATEQNQLDKSADDNKETVTKNNRNDGRSISQNRVLGKRNNDKSTTKQPTKKNDQSFDQPEKPKISGRQKPKQSEVKLPMKAVQKGKAEVKLSPLASKKKKKNVFQDNSEVSSSQSQHQSRYFKADNKRQSQQQRISDQQLNRESVEVIAGVFLSENQLQQILQKFNKKQGALQQSESEKMSSLRKKYTELCQLVQEERQNQKVTAERERQQFEAYKSEQLNKIKNERRIMERQVKNGGSQNVQKEREELQALKKEMERERQEFKKKEKNSKIIVDKYKKENEELRARLERLEAERETAESKRSSNNVKVLQDNFSEKATVSAKNSAVVKKRMEDDLKEVNYKQIKKDKNQKDLKDSRESKEMKEKQKKPLGKIKYEYEEEPTPKNKSNSVKNQKKAVQMPSDRWANANFNNDSENDDDASDNENEANQVQQLQEQSTNVQWSPTMKLSDLTRIDLSIKMVTDQMINTLFRFQNNLEYRTYRQSINSPSREVVNTTRNSKNSFTSNVYSDGSKEIVYDNGTRKQSMANGYSIVYFKNGDVKQSLSDKTVIYFFKEKEVDQITLSNGINIYRFENNQVEFHFDAGKYIEIRHPDGTIKVLGSEPTRR